MERDDGTGPEREVGAPRFGVLVALSGVLVAWLVAGPSSGRWQLVVVSMLASLVFGAGTWATRPPRGARSYVAIAVLAAIGSILALAISARLAELVVALWLLAVAIYLPYRVVRVLRARAVVDVQLVLGAIGIYLLIGLGFAMALTIADVFEQAPLFVGAHGLTNGAFRDRVYFSFVSLSTTGYGDIVPSSGTARALAILESLSGQIYLVTAVSATVGLVVGGRSRS